MSTEVDEVEVAEAPPVAASAVAPPTVDAVVEKYIALRDRKAELKKKFDAAVEDIDTALKRCEGYLLRVLNEQGAESVKTAAGTAYVSVKTSASVADREAFLNFIRERDEWSMLDARAAKSVIAEYQEANGDLPPGINWSAMRTVNVRR